jgi:hypothetical protein
MLAACLFVLGAASAAVGAFARTSPGAMPGATRQAPARLLVGGEEYRLTLSRQTIRSGPALIQFLNRGEDPHDLRLRRIGRTTGYAAKAPETGPGELVQLEARLVPGRYRMWCSIEGHRKLGMRAVLTVKRRR